MVASDTYVPGVCNINTTEVNYRRKAMITGFVVAAGLFLGLWLLNVPSWVAALAASLPLFVGFVGVLQVRNRFCVSYGASGRQNADETSNTAQSVGSAADRQTDKQKARKMNLQALLMTVVTVAVLALLP